MANIRKMTRTIFQRYGKKFHFSVTNTSDVNDIWRLCMKCGNMKFRMIRNVRCHIYWTGFDANH